MRTKATENPLYTVWAHVKRKTSDPNFATFEAFAASIPPQPSPSHRFSRLDSAKPFTVANSFWKASDQHLPAQQNLPPEPAFTSGKIYFAGPRTRDLWTAICGTCHTELALPLPTESNPAICHLCEGGPTPTYPKPQRVQTKRQIENARHARASYHRRKLK